MTKRKLKAGLLGTLGCASLLLAGAGNAATVELQWQDIDDFRDVRSVNGGQDKFERRTLQSLEEMFRSEAEALPANHTLHLTVKDLNLAGEIEYFHPGYPFGLRVIRNLDFPTMDLAWELRDEHDTVIRSGDETIRDMGFRTSSFTRYDRFRSPLDYEEDLISDWFQETFGDITGETVNLNEET